MFAHLVDSTITVVSGQNDSDAAIQICRKYEVGCFTEVYYESCLQVSYLDMATKASKEVHSFLNPSKIIYAGIHGNQASLLWFTGTLMPRVAVKTER